MALFAVVLAYGTPAVADVTSQKILSAPVDVSPAFRDFANTYFIANHVAEFDQATGAGKLSWQRSAYTWGMALELLNAIPHV